MPAFGGGGSPSAGTTSVAPETPATIPVGAKLFAVIQNKYPPNAPVAPSGYTLGAQASGGSGSSGADAGDVYTTLFARDADGTEGGATVTVSIPSGNASIGKVVYFTKNPGAAWELEYKTGADEDVGEDWSVAFGNTDLRVGDLVLVVSTVNGNTYEYSAPALTAPGLTFLNVERATNTIANGDDLGWMVSTHEVLTGHGIVAPTFTMLASGSAGDEPAGSAVLVRMRELGGTTLGAQGGGGGRGTTGARFIPNYQGPQPKWFR